MNNSTIASHETGWLRDAVISLSPRARSTTRKHNLGTSVSPLAAGLTELLAPQGIKSRHHDVKGSPGSWISALHDSHSKSCWYRRKFRLPYQPFAFVDFAPQTVQAKLTDPTYLSGLSLAEFAHWICGLNCATELICRRSMWYAFGSAAGARRTGIIEPPSDRRATIRNGVGDFIFMRARYEMNSAYSPRPIELPNMISFRISSTRSEQDGHVGGMSCAHCGVRTSMLV